jgi:hypothetical protein
MDSLAAQERAQEDMAAAGGFSVAFVSQPRRHGYRYDTKASVASVLAALVLATRCPSRPD